MRNTEPPFFVGLNTGSLKTESAGFTFTGQGWAVAPFSATQAW
jgi:hypothetical protein